jgi:hypothetical protein
MDILAGLWMLRPVQNPSSWHLWHFRTKRLLSIPATRSLLYTRPPSQPVLSLSSDCHTVSDISSRRVTQVSNKCVGAFTIIFFMLVFYALALWDRWLYLKRREQNRVVESNQSRRLVYLTGKEAKCTVVPETDQKKHYGAISKHTYPGNVKTTNAVGEN